ncbi:MAG: ABC transporter ATP-binding protein [Acetomicrobium sp.]
MSQQRSPAYDILFKDVWFSYNNSFVLRQVSFSVPPKEFLVIIGPNGGGKTTLLKLVLGLCVPRRGEVRLFDGLEPRQALHLMGYVPQNTNFNLDFPVRVLDVVLMGRLRGIKCFYTKEDKEMAYEALKTMGMNEYASAMMSELSQGQRQRVLIARALTSQPKILLLDEPTANVDIEAQKILYDKLRELNEKITVVLVSHDMTVITSYATAVACVNGTVYYHDSNEITPEMLQMAYGYCPVEIVAHGIPHRVLSKHDGEQDA